MFGRWFARALPVEDCVWPQAAACEAGLRREAERSLGTGAVLVLLRSTVDLGDAAAALARPTLRVGTDHYAAADLRAHLAQAGALGLACVDDLRSAPARAPRPAPLDVHVRARAVRRSEDERLLDLLRPWAPRRVVFHHALDDVLLRDYAATLTPLLQRLGVGAETPVASPLLTAALRRVQRP